MKRNLLFPVLLCFGLSLLFIQGCAMGSVNLVKDLTEPISNYRAVAVKVECSDAVPADLRADAVTSVKNIFISTLTDAKRFDDIYDYDKARDKAQLWIKIMVTKYTKVDHTGMSIHDMAASAPTTAALDVNFVNAKSNEVIGEVTNQMDIAKGYNKMTEIEAAVYFCSQGVVDYITKSK